MPDPKYKFTPPAAPAAPPVDEGVIKKYGPGMIRGLSGFVGFAPQTGAIAGGGGEILAEMLEKGTINPLNLDAKRIAGATAVGGAMGGYVKGLKVGGGMIRAAAKGALMGGSAPVIKHAVEEHKLAPLSEVASGAVVGGATGGILEKFLGWHHNPDVTPPTKLDILQGADAFHDVTTRAPHTVDIPKKEAYVHQPPVTDSPRVAKVVANEAKTKLADATQEARAIDKRVKASDTIVKAHAGAEAEQLKRDFDAIAAQKVQNAKNTLLEQGAEWTPKTVSESSSTKVAGGKQSTSTKLKVPPPPEGEVDPTVADTLGPSDASGPDSPAPILSKPTKPSTVSGTKRFFANKKEAITAAQNRGMNVVLNDAGTYELIPFEKTVTPTSTTSTPSDKTYRTWAEARGAAKLSGGDVSGDLKSGFKVGTKSAPTTDITNQFTPEDLSKFSEHGIDQLKNGVDTPRIEAPARLQSEGEIKGAQESQAISDIIHGEDAPSIGNGTGEDSPLPPVTMNLKPESSIQPRGVIPTLDKPVDEMMERQGVTAGTNKAIGQPMSPPSGLVLSKKLEGEGWDRIKFGEEPPPTPKSAEPPAIDPNAEADIADLQSLTPEQRKNAIAAMIKGEKGAIDPVLMARLGLGMGGALAGAAVDKEDPLTGAILGGSAGAMLPSAGPMLANLASKEAPEAGGLVKALTSRINNWQRSALLSDPKSIAWNSFGGPMGSHFFGGLEQTLKGAVKGDADQLDMGKRILGDAVNLPKWAQGYGRSLKEAANIVHQADIGRAGFDAPRDPNIIDRIMKLPADWMTAGDLNVKTMLKNQGVPEKLAEQITLTAEPQQALTKNIANWGKTTTEGGAASKIANLMLPFKRTAANILESGIQRTPGLGEVQNLVNAFKDPQLQIPFKERLVNQGLGGAVFGTAYYAGLNTPSGTAKDWKLNSLASNLGGQYAMLSGIGFAMGQAKRLGQNPRTAFTKEAGGDIPLPTTGPLMEIISPFLKVASGEPLTKKDIPRSMYPRILTYAEKQLQSTTEAPPSSYKFTPPE